MKSRARVEANALQNARTARVFPASGDDRGLAEYWGWEAAQAMLSVDRNPHGQFVQLDCDHAWRCVKIAWYHALRYRGIKKEQQ